MGSTSRRCSLLQGLPTIRAYGAGDRFRASFLEELDLNCSWWFGYIATARWYAATCRSFHHHNSQAACCHAWLAEEPALCMWRHTPPISADAAAVYPTDTFDMLATGWASGWTWWLR